MRVCEAHEVPELLPDALAGRFVLAPLGPHRDAELAMLRPDLEVTEPGAAVIVATSGSTGRPKGVVLSRDALLAAAEANRKFLGSPSGRWHVVLPMHYVAGLMVVVRALHAGHPPIVADGVADLTPVAGKANYTSLVPTQLHRALADERLTRVLAGFEAILLGGAAAEAKLLAKARHAGLRIVTTYGASETCGGVVYDGLTLPGVDAQLGEAGRISLGGPTLMSGYRLRPHLTELTLVNGRVLTNDWGEWRCGRLMVRGRLDDIVITGGVNVDLADVQRAIDLVDADGGRSVIAGIPSDEWGTELVLITESDRDLAWWRRELAARCDRPALPRRVVRVDELPLTTSGKLDRQALRRLGGEQGLPVQGSGLA